MRFAFLVALLAAGPAAAQAPVEEATQGVLVEDAGWGTISRLEDRIAGRLRPVTGTSRQVTIVRDGVEFTAAPDAQLGGGDAIRSADGRCTVRLRDGGEVTVGGRSQVRLDPSVGWLHRLGTLDARGPETAIVVGALRIFGVDADLRVVRDIPGDAELTVLSGTVTVQVGDGAPVGVAPGERAQLTQRGLTASAPLDADALAALIEDRAPPPAPGEAGERAGDRAHLRIHGGLSRIHEADFGRFGLAARIRLIGPVFFAVGGGLALRGVAEDSGVDTAFVIPAHAGVRVLGSLPGALSLFGGVDFTAFVGEWCAGGSGCISTPAFEPGARALFGAALELAPVVGLDVTVAGGVVRRVLPGFAETPGAVVPEAQVDFAIGIYFRI